jgi:hypothetical protein
VLEAEDNMTAAIEAVSALAEMALSSAPAYAPIPSTPNTTYIAPSLAPMTQLTELESNLIQAVTDLKPRRRIIGTAPTLEELLNLIEEREIGDSPYRFEGRDAEIVAQVTWEQAIECGELIEIDDSESKDKGPDLEMSNREVMKLCEQLEQMCLKYAYHKENRELSAQLHRFRGRLRQEEMWAQKQVSLDHFWPTLRECS